MNPSYIISLMTNLLKASPFIEAEVIEPADLQKALMQPKSALTIHYAGSSFVRMPVEAEQFQVRTVRFVISLYYRSLVPVNSTIPAIQQIYRILNGTPFNAVPDKLQVTGDEVVEYNRKENIYVHQLFVSASYAEL